MAGGPWATPAAPGKRGAAAGGLGFGDGPTRNCRAVNSGTFISIAGALGMITTAEGVETADQRQFLAALGCDEMQGYLFSAPVPVAQIPELVTKWSTASLAA
jgi:hypothetical protein